MKVFRLLLLLCWFAATTVASGAPAGMPVAALLNPKFLAHMNRQAVLSAVGVDSETANYGLVPEPFVLPKASPKAMTLGVRSSSSLPAMYDLRPLGKLTPITNQGNCGSCWAFAAYGSLESSLMPGQTWDFSENNIKNRHGFDLACCDGGDRAIVAAYLARWDGPMSETDDPYNTSSCTSPAGLSPRKHVQDMAFIPDRSGPLDNDGLKSAVMQYGAIYTTFYYDGSYYRSSQTSYYCPSTIEANHAVCIVGWNDHYPAANFLTSPPGDGAFICRNSWGPSWGAAGYFYMSYYDANFGIENAAFIASSPDEYTTQYGYDRLGLVNCTGYGADSAWFAMKFTPTEVSVLRAAAWYTAVNDAAYELKIYAHPTGSPTTGTLVSSKVGTLPTAGYHTIRLDSPVVAAPGTVYSCVVRLTTPGCDFPVPYEYPISSAYTSTATAHSDETYMSPDGSAWTDTANWTANASVCLKTFGSPPMVSDIKVVADGAQVRLVTKVVSAVFADCIYVRESTVPSGIRVNYTGGGVSQEDTVTVTGTLGTYKPDGAHSSERVILSPSVTVIH